MTTLATAPEGMMATCTACGKNFDTLFSSVSTVCPECQAAQAEFEAKSRQSAHAIVVTPCLVGLNVLVFFLMAASGVSILEPDLADLIRWGANFGTLSLGPQPWRVVTAMFVHIGIIHLAFNMWCLWSLGQLAERWIGSWNFLVLYLLSGIGGSLVSLWLHPQLVGAGASGAIFGVAGGLAAVLGMKKAQIPSVATKQTFKSVLAFIGYNLLYGLRGGIDNAAHIGGLLSGAALGAFMPRRTWVADSASRLGSSFPETHVEASPSFKLAAGALGCVLFLGFGAIRRAHSRASNAGETIHLELLQLKKVDRMDLQQAAKLVESNNTNQAVIDKLKTVSSHAPTSSLPHLILAEAYTQQRQYEQAIAEYRKAIDLLPNYAPAHSELGLALFQNRQYDEAVQEERIALRLDPKNSRSHNNLGIALERTGDLKGALEEYRAACALDSKNQIAAKNLRRLQQATGQ